MREGHWKTISAIDGAANRLETNRLETNRLETGFGLRETGQETEFAPGPRSCQKEILQHHENILQHRELCLCLDALPDIALVLNQERQIIYGNAECHRFAESIHRTPLLGMRPGDLFACDHLPDAPCGCGTGKACRTCGAVKSILTALGGERCSEECHLLARLPEGFAAKELRVTSTPTNLDTGNFVIVIVNDISSEKRRRILERSFLHDFQNVLTVFGGVAFFLGDDTYSIDEAKAELTQGYHSLKDLVLSYQQLVNAEANEIEVAPKLLRTGPFLKRVKQTCSQLSRGASVELKIALECAETEFKSDITLLHRVMVNLVKNAIEASQSGDTVTIGCRVSATKVRLWCHSHPVIPPEVQQQVFHRSFSSKGVGRGLGAYTAKLFIDNYLNGEISLVSNDTDRTVFTVSLPR